jgi:hypothetical protein
VVVVIEEVVEDVDEVFVGSSPWNVMVLLSPLDVDDARRDEMLPLLLLRLLLRTGDNAFVDEDERNRTQTATARNRIKRER